MATSSPPRSLTPSEVAACSQELRTGPPFAQMSPADVERFVSAAVQTRWSAGQVMLQPSDGPVARLRCICRGAVSGRQGLAEQADGGFQYEAGDLFPVSAMLGGRAVTATYEAVEDTVCLEVDAAVVHELAARSAPFAAALSSRTQQLLELSQRALRATQASLGLTESSLEAPLSSLPRKAALAVRPGTPLRQALQLMHDRRVGSVLVIDEPGALHGILTRHDVLERVALRQPRADATIDDVMTRPVHALDIGHSAQDAVLLMSAHGIRHVPLTERGQVVSLVSERDLFALQRRSLRQVSALIRAATEPPQLVEAAAEIRRFARDLVAQGLSARSLTRLLSHLNDLLTERLLRILAPRHGRDLRQACWLAFGSEGRSEQTIATDQDNGLVFVSARPDADRPAWLAFADAVNQGLDACGYPLCKGNVMARNPQCCLTTDEWCARFAHWMEHGAPEDLLNASIYFDFRPLAGDAALVEPMRQLVQQRAARLPRFMKQMADNALRHRPALNWRGALDPQVDKSGEWIDLKLNGTAIFVDTARLYALAHGVGETGTVARFEGLQDVLKVPRDELRAWISAFEYLQMFRLRIQMEGSDLDNPNRVDLRTLDQIDRRILRESFRMARQLQQRLELDYRR